MDPEKRIRREIANSNERRRMQSINSGFNSLRTMLPKHDGEKLSKAAILQHTAEYIDTLEQEKTRLLSQQHQLKRLITSIANGQQGLEDLQEHQLVKKLKTEHHESSDSADEGIHCNPSPIETLDDVDALKAELIEVRKAVDRERKLRMQLEEQVKQLETQLYPERVKEIAQSVQVKFHKQGSEVGSLDNSADENDAAVASLVEDDVIGETIEIETGSCPSPPVHQLPPTTIVIQGPGNTTYTTTPIQLRTASGQQVIHVQQQKQDTSKTRGKGKQQAAIALPIEVPFMGGTAGGGSQGSGNTVTLQIINNGDQSAGNSTSRHNLETIVEAIRHLEGDHMFKEEEAACVAVDGTVLEEHEVITSEEVVTEEKADVKTVVVSTSGASSTGVLRQKVIKTNLPSKSQSRPGVIVAKIN